MSTETYIVSVYRRGGEPGKEITGLAERPGSGKRTAFASSQELWAFLCDSKPVLPAVTTIRRTRGRKKT